MDAEFWIFTAFFAFMVVFFLVILSRNKRAMAMNREIVNGNTAIRENQETQIKLHERQALALERIATALESKNAK